MYLPYKQTERQNHVIILGDTIKAFDENPEPWMVDTKETVFLRHSRMNTHMKSQILWQRAQDLK